MYIKLAQESSGCLKRRKYPAGFTLTEVIVSSTLLLVAVVPILQALTNSHRTAVTVEHRTVSLNIAQQKLEEITARSINSYSSNFNVSNSAQSGGYLCSVSDSAVSSNLRTIAVSAGFDDNGDGVLGSSEVQVSLRSLLAKRK